MGIIIKAQEIYKNEGALSLSKRGIKKAVRYIFETNSAYWLEKELSQEILPIQAQIPLEMDFHSAQQTIEWMKTNAEPWVFNPREIAVGLKEGHLFACARYQEEIIACVKVGLGKVYIQDYRKITDITKDSAFIYDTYVLPEFRRQGVAKYMVAEITRFLKNKGIRKLGCHIPPWNTASLNTYIHLGFKRVRYTRHLRIFGFLAFNLNY